MANLRAAINNKCKECIYDSCAKGTWRYQVEACSSTSCPLYSVRPRTVVQDSSNLGEKTTETAQLRGRSIPTQGSSERTNNSGAFPIKTSFGFPVLPPKRSLFSREDV